MKKVVVLQLLMPIMLFHNMLLAQTSIQGTLQDGTGKALGFANALLLHASDSTLFRGLVVSPEGTYTFENVPVGRYLLSISMVGFEQYFSDAIVLEQASESIILQPVQLLESNASLAEVQVVAKKPFLEQKIDRMVVNVANSITNAGGTALEVLQRSPGIQVNSLTKSISLLGKEGVVVMINGKISRQPPDAIVQMLAGMNANNIDRIELIHTPPANFEAEGNAGIINIILKSSGDEGFNGGYSANIGYGKAEKYGAGTYFNYRKNKFNWFGNYNYSFNLNPQVFTNYRGVQQGANFLETASYSERPYTPTPTQNARIGLDVQVSPKTVVGVLGTFFDRNWFMKAVNSVTYSKNGQVESRLQMPNSETNHNQSFAGNINLTHQFTNNQSLNIDADIVRFNMYNPSNYIIQNQDAAGNIMPEYELRINKETPIRVAVAKVDYLTKIGEKINLENGAKLTSMQFENDVRLDSLPFQQNWIPIDEFTSLVQLNESVIGVYSTFSAKIDDKTDIKAGLRFEHTNTNLGSEGEPDIVDRDYGSWFPNVYIGRKLSATQNLNFSYSRRISRPKISQLAPWLIFADPTTLESGNPALQPAFTNALKLDYGFSTWRVGIAYSIEDNPMRGVPRVDPIKNRQVNVDENLDNQKVASANLFFPLHLVKWWSAQNNFYVNSTEINFILEGRKTQLSNINYGFNSSHSFTLPHQFTLEISGNYDSPGFWGVAKWTATGSANIGLQKDFGQKWGKLRLNASDLFLSTNWFGTTNQPEANLQLKQSYQFAERIFMLSWSNTFGSKKLKSERNRQMGAAEEMNRI